MTESNARIQFSVATIDEWERVNPKLRQGELVVAKKSSGKYILKVGAPGGSTYKESTLVWDQDDAENKVNMATTAADNASASADKAANSASAAKTSATNVKTSESNAKTSETNAASSASAANASKVAASTSENAAKNSATNAAGSATEAKTSETNAASSAKAAADSAKASAASADAATTAADNASASADKAANSASAAKTSETNAGASAVAAANSASAAKTSAANAKTYADNLKNPVRTVTENDGRVTVTQVDGAKSQFNAGVNILTRNTAYTVGDIAYSPNLPSWAYLECTTAGTTGTSEPDFTNIKSGGVIIDGSAKFGVMTHFSTEKFNAWLDKQTVKAGDAVIYSYIHSAGFITGGGTNINVSLPLNKYASKTLYAVSISGEFACRQNGKYILQSSTTNSDPQKLSDVFATMTATLPPNGFINLSFVLSKTLSAISNNTALTMTFYDLKIQF